jgi:hypothetical protein
MVEPQGSGTAGEQVVTRFRRVPRLVYSETPIADRLGAFTMGNTLATYHGQPGGEWDTLRNAPLRLRQRLTSAGWMSRRGEKPDVFVDLLRVYGAPDDEDLIAWYLREANRAVLERRRVHDADVRLSRARLAGHRSYYELRTAQVRTEGHASLWAYRKASGWT